MRDRRLEVFIDDQFATAIGRQPNCLEIELIAVGISSHSIEQCLTLHFFPALQLGEDALLIPVETNGNNFLPQAKDGAKLPQLEAEALDDLAVNKIQEVRPLI